MTRIIKEKQVHTRIIAGTHWPVTHQLCRKKVGNQRPFWVVVKYLCNGIPDESVLFSTLTKASEYFDTL